MDENQNQNSSDFMKETIKQRPLNRRKLLRRTLITAALAVVFGMVACFTFLLLEPVISNRLYPEEEPEVIEFVEETEESEILPEDMYIDDSEMQPESTAESAVTLESEQIEQVLSKIQLDADDYLSLSEGVRKVAREAQNSIVTVTGVTSDIGWLDYEFENEGIVSGVLVADNGRELLILADVNSIQDAEDLRITFADGEEYAASLKKKDMNTKLAVLSVLKSTLKKSTLLRVKTIPMGTSANSNLSGSPVIAIGRLINSENSICYGNITSAGSRLIFSDSNYRHLTTDIYGSSNASGILVNLRGQMIGVVHMSDNSSEMKNMVSAIGITELKKVIEYLSNGKEIPYLGIYGVDVTREANESQEVPYGAYVLEIDMDSPAMNAGIQSGDVIVKVRSGAEEVTVEDYQELVRFLQAQEPQNNLQITLMRQGPDGYAEMKVQAEVGIQAG